MTFFDFLQTMTALAGIAMILWGSARLKYYLKAML